MGRDLLSFRGHFKCCMKFDQQFQFHSEFHFSVIILFLKTDSFTYASSWKAINSKIKTVNEDFAFTGKTANLKNATCNPAINFCVLLHVYVWFSFATLSTLMCVICLHFLIWKLLQYKITVRDSYRVQIFVANFFLKALHCCKEIAGVKLITWDKSKVMKRSTIIPEILFALSKWSYC